MIQTQQGARLDGLPRQVQDERWPDAIDFINRRRATILEQNRDNVVFESGSIGLRGNEAIRAGSYVKLIRGTDVVGAALGGGSLAEYYAARVAHAFLPFRSFTTTVTFDRGTGFIERVQKAAPYLEEIAAGGVYR